METKVCFKCGRELPLDNFYKHKGTLDGHLGKCKDCAKKDARKNHRQNSLNEEWVEKERVRARERYRRLNYGQKYQETTRIDFPGVHNVARKLKRKGVETKGKEAHHWNYNFPNSVFLLSSKAHHIIHANVIMNREDKCCYTKDGVKIENAEQAKTIYEDILKDYGVIENLEYFNI